MPTKVWYELSAIKEMEWANEYEGVSDEMFGVLWFGRWILGIFYEYGVGSGLG